jgi:hypothetical protein
MNAETKRKKRRNSYKTGSSNLLESKIIEQEK